jgi:hypothetical protein
MDTWHGQPFQRAHLGAVDLKARREIPAARYKASIGLVMDTFGQSFSEVPLVVSHGKNSILNTITREVCEDCNHELGKLEQAVQQVFVALAHAAESGSSLEIAVEDARMLARWAEKMAMTNKLTSNFPKVATSVMGQSLLRGDTICSSLSGRRGIRLTTC